MSIRETFIILVLCRPSKNMDFLASIKFYLKLFYIFGHSPRLFTYNQHNQKWCCFENIFIILHTIIGLSLITSCFIPLNMKRFQHNWNTIEIVIINFVLICDTFRILSIFGQCIFYKKHLSSVINTFQWFQRYYVNNFQHLISYKKFRRRYSVKALVVSYAFLQHFLVFMWIARYRLSPIGVQIKILQAFRVCTILHALFYIDCVSFHLHELNGVVENEVDSDCARPQIFYIPSEYKSKSFVTDRLRCYKFVYMNLSQSMHSINTFFGWSLMAIMTHGFAETIYSSYWCYKHMHDGWRIPQTLRESKYVYSQFMENYVNILFFLEILRTISQYLQYVDLHNRNCQQLPRLS